MLSAMKKSNIRFCPTVHVYSALSGTMASPPRIPWSPDSAASAEVMLKSAATSQRTFAALMHLRLSFALTLLACPKPPVEIRRSV